MLNSRTRTGCVVATLLLSVGLGACSSGADSRKEGGDAQPTSSSATSQTPAQRLAAVKTVMDGAESMHLELSSTGVPASANGVLDGSGTGTRQPGFQGDLTAKLGGIQAKVPVVAVNDTVWAKLPIWKEMRTIQPSTYGAPDPAQLFSTDKGISSLLPKTKNPTQGAERRDGSDTVRVFTGTLSGPDVVGVLSIGSPAQPYQVEYLVTDDNQLRQAKITGSFFNAAGTAYTLRLDEYGKKFVVRAPA